MKATLQRSLLTPLRNRVVTLRFLRRCAWTALACGTFMLAAWLALPLIPLPAALFSGTRSETEFLDRAGQPLRLVRNGEEPFRRPARYAEIPRALIEATLAAEDRRFWQHPGVDVRATVRAIWQWIRHRRVVSGGSTITQQLIKLAEPRRRTMGAKLIEAAQALRLEQVWGKQQILAEYLNRLDYGNFNRGCAAAAAFYFAKPLRDLSPAECAFLAGLPQAPTRLNPQSHFDRAAKRQRWILGRMHEAGWLTDAELQRAGAEPLQLAVPRRVFEAPHFIDLLLAAEAAGNASVEMGGGSIRTTLDLALNRFAEQTLRRHLSHLAEQHVSNGAIVILDNQTGDVLSLVGSENYFAPLAGQVNVAWAPRSAGSTFKPFAYLLALERGATPSTVVADVPTEFATATGLFAPVNYDRHCYGPMRQRLALANSLNISAVKVLASVGGPEPLQHLLQQCGLSTLGHPAEHYGLGLTIGNAEARLLELANAYSCLARLGLYRPYRLLPTPTLPAASLERVCDPATAYLIADMLSDNDARLMAFGADSPLRFDFRVACKTGTSSDFRDNWAFGYTPEFTVGVRVGNSDGSPMRHVSGVSGAAPVLHALFEHLHERYGTTWYPMPTNVVECWIHPITGKRLNQSGALSGRDAIKEKFLASNLPPFESPNDYEATGVPGRSATGPLRAVRLGNEYRDWLASGDNWLGERAVFSAEQDSLRIVFPVPGTVIHLDSDLPQRGRRLLLRAAGSENLEWHSDSLQFIREADRQVALLTEGRHRLTLRDPANGAQATTWIDVVAR